MRKKKGEKYQKLLKELNDKYANDPDFREHRRVTNRERYQNDPEFRERALERARKRYENDPAYRQKTYDKAVERYKKSKEKGQNPSTD